MENGTSRSSSRTQGGRDVRHLAVRASAASGPLPHLASCGTRARRRAPPRRGRDPSGHRSLGGSATTSRGVAVGREHRVEDLLDASAPRRRARAAGRAGGPAIAKVGSPSACAAATRGRRAPDTACGCARRTRSDPRASAPRGPRRARRARRAPGRGRGTHRTAECSRARRGTRPSRAATRHRACRCADRRRAPRTRRRARRGRPAPATSRARARERAPGR